MKMKFSMIAVVLFVFPMSISAFASTDTWQGNVAGANTADRNWDVNSYSYSPSAWEFGGAGAAGASINNNLVGFTVQGITFDSGAPKYTISGSPIINTGGIVNYGTNLQTLSMDIDNGGQPFGVVGTGDVTLGGIISGSGSLTKSGGSTLMLTGTNSYTGDTEINTGTLVIDGGSIAIPQYLTVGNAAGSSVLNIMNGGTVSDGYGTIGYVSGSSSTVTVTGTGSTWTNNYQMNVGTYGSGTLNVTNGGKVYNYLNGVYIGDASGSGTIIVDGSASALNTVSLHIGYGSTITTNSLTISNGGDVKIGNGSGTVTLGLNNSVGILNIGSNQTSTAAGILEAGAVNGLSGIKSKVYFNENDAAYTFSPNLTGNLSVAQDGVGTTILTGNNSYSGGTTISSGKLRAGSANALGIGAVSNNSGGTLDLATTSLVLNSYTQNSGSSLILTANSPSSYGNITTPISNPAVIDAASAIHVTVTGSIPKDTVLTILNTSGGGIVGDAPTTVTSTDPSIRFLSSILNNNLILTAENTATNFSSLGSNSNAQAAGLALDNITNPSSGMTTILNMLEGLSNAQVTEALNTMVPVVDAGVRDNSAAALNNFIGASIERVQNVLTSAGAGNSNASGLSAGDENKLNGIWAKQYGSYLNQGADQGVQGYNAWNTGTAVGFDRLLGDTLTLGISGGYSYGKVNSDTNSAAANINSAQSAVYAGYQDGNHPYFIDAAASSAWNWYSGQRNISAGTLDLIASSNYRGEQYGTYLDGGYNYNINNKLQLTPLASLQWDHLALGHYTETNAGDLDLRVNRQSYDMLESGLGIRVSTPKISYQWGDLVPEVHAKWLHDFISNGMAVTSTYTGGGGAFATYGIKPPMNGANLGAKLSFDLKKDVSIIAGIDTQIKDRFFAVYGSGEIRYRF